jgi:hypothetical protein
VEVEAVHLGDAWPRWLTDAWLAGTVFKKPDVSGHVFIKTTEGEMRASYKDWIIRGPRGEIYPCEVGIFNETYEPIK